MPRLDRISTTFNPNDTIPDTLGDLETFSQTATFNNGITVNGASNLNSNVTVGNNLTVSQTATFNSGITVNGASNLNSSVTVGNNLSVSGSTTVTGDVTLHNLYVNSSVLSNNNSATTVGYAPAANPVTDISKIFFNAYFNSVFTGLYSSSASSIMPSGTCMLGPNDSNFWWQSYGVHTYSDARLKENVTDYDAGLDLVNQLRPVTYTWKEGHGDNKPNRTKATHHGFLAQEVGELLPHICGAGGDGEHNSIDYSRLVAILCSAVQELGRKVNSQNEEIAEMKDTLDSILQ